MLRIYYGDYEGDNYIQSPAYYFDNVYEDSWLMKESTKDMVRRVDESEIISPYLVNSSVLGPIPPTLLSGGVKTLILIDNDSEHVFNASACGNNCSKLLLEIAKDKDVTIRLGYPMIFEEPFKIFIVNTGTYATTRKELITTIFNLI